MNDFDTVNMNKAQKAVYYFREYGWEYTKNRALKKLGFKVPEENEYMIWLRKKKSSAKELDRQRKNGKQQQMTVDVITDTDANAMETLEKSVKKQTFPVQRIVKLGKNPEDGNRQSAGKSGGELAEALGRTSGEILVFAAPGVILEPEAVYRYVNVFAEHGEAELVYSDEDCGTADRKHRMKPYFKPDIAPELLCSFQYIGGVFAVRRGLLERIAENSLYADLELSGNGWYDLVFAAVETLMREEKEAARAGAEIDTSDFSRVHPLSVYHIADVLFTKITDKDFRGFYRNTDKDRKRYIEKHLKRTGRADATVTESDVPGFYHVKYALPEKRPLLSILIPTKDHTEDLDVCIQSVISNNDYRNFEIVIAENNSEKPETFAYYEKLTGQTYDKDSVITGKLPEGQTVKVVTWQGEFNYSGINNFAAQAAEGELFLFLNNDTEIMNREAFTELAASCMAEDAGGSGAMLYYKDGTIQHGGVVYKIGGFAANALWSLSDRDEKYYPYSVTAREMSCCTAACLMLKREAFEAAGGFDEKLCVALNDVDLCMKVRQAGYKIIFNPHAKLHHYESKSRGLETTPEKQERFNREIAYFQSKWQEKIDLGDPYYNVNQTLHYANYAIELAEDNRGRYRC